MKIGAARLVLLRPRLADAPPYISGAAGANPLFRRPRLLIAEQRNRPRGALIVRQTQAFVRDRAPVPVGNLIRLAREAESRNVSIL
jgi:hypothetical protein